MNGLINLYKPALMSSAAAVSKVKRILGTGTVGHMGTLDPMAEGVLVIGVGKSARLFDYLSGGKKTYIAKFKFGSETDTLDALGKVTATTRDIPSVDAVLGAMLSLVGEIEQVPPAYSAKHINGARSYELARSGRAVTPQAVKVTVYDAQLICQPALDETVFMITCSAGTYIRAICRDVALLCGSLATLTYLKRTAAGVFTDQNAVTIEELEEKGQAAIIPPQDIIDLPRLDLDECYDELIKGKKIFLDLDGKVAVFGRGELFGIGVSENGVLKIKPYLHD